MPWQVQQHQQQMQMQMQQQYGMPPVNQGQYGQQPHPMQHYGQMQASDDARGWAEALCISWRWSYVCFKKQLSCPICMLCSDTRHLIHLYDLNSEAVTGWHDRLVINYADGSLWAVQRGHAWARPAASADAWDDGQHGLWAARSRALLRRRGSALTEQH